MTKIIGINDNDPHKVSEVICVRCAKRWICVRPSEVKLIDLKCPECKNQGYVIETGEIITE